MRKSQTALSPYLSENLIAYIGNKRRLLPFLETHIRAILEKDARVSSFADYFAGSGSVARLARYFGLRTHANDWEYYAYILNYAHLAIVPDDEKNMFLKLGGLSRALETLNALPDLPYTQRYLARYYAPENDDAPDCENERMFYTNANARRIDRIRETIEAWRTQRGINLDEYYYLLAALLYEAATHANTSGVFKGFHNGFGGRHGDALGRIMGEITMRKLPLLEGPRGTATRMDANELPFALRDGERYDIVYLDPPYNQHQYGSNYHMLNTIALWDKPRVNKNVYVNGKKTNKSAIRKDWTKTRSPYCYRESARNAFAELIQRIDARYILLSYSTDGIIPIEEIAQTLSTRGRLTVASEEYTRYPGAKQSVVNRTKNVEYLFIVETERKRAARAHEAFLKRIALERARLLLLCAFNGERKIIRFKGHTAFVTLRLSDGIYVTNREAALAALSKETGARIAAFNAFISAFTLSDASEETAVCLRKLQSAPQTEEAALVKRLLPRIAELCNKFHGARGNKRFMALFPEFFEWLGAYLSRKGRDACASSDIGKILALAERTLEELTARGFDGALLRHQIMGIKGAYERMQREL